MKSFFKSRAASRWIVARLLSFHSDQWELNSTKCSLLFCSWLLWKPRLAYLRLLFCTNFKQRRCGWPGRAANLWLCSISVKFTVFSMAENPKLFGEWKAYKSENFDAVLEKMGKRWICETLTRSYLKAWEFCFDLVFLHFAKFAGLQSERK